MLIWSYLISTYFTNTIMATRLKDIVELCIFVADDAFTDIIICFIDIIYYLLNINLIFSIFTRQILYLSRSQWTLWLTLYLLLLLKVWVSPHYWILSLISVGSFNSSAEVVNFDEIRLSYIVLLIFRWLIAKFSAKPPDLKNRDDYNQQ